jgi:predicted transglutaminase-like cysteine proteinase
MNAYLLRVFLCVCAATAVALIFAVVPADAQILRKDGVLPALAGHGHEPFGLSSGVAPAGPMWIRWREFDIGVVQSAQALARCRAEAATCSQAELRLIAVIDSVRNVEGRAKFGIVNREINLSIAYASDQLQHASGDVWSSALATFSAGQGDCEDFAIAKYLALREAGVATQDLRLLIGRLPSIGQAHAVVAARLDGRWLILDNRRMMMLEDIHATELQPLFAFDHAGVKQFGAPAMMVANSRRETQDTPVMSTAAAMAGGALPVLM